MKLVGDHSVDAAYIRFAYDETTSVGVGRFPSFQAKRSIGDAELWFLLRTHPNGWLHCLEFLAPTVELPLSLVPFLRAGVDHDGSVGLRLPPDQRIMPEPKLMEVRLEPASERCYLALGMPAVPQGSGDGVQRLRPDACLLEERGIHATFDVDCELRLIGIELADYRKSLAPLELEHATILSPGEPLRPWNSPKGDTCRRRVRRVSTGTP